MFGPSYNLEQCVAIEINDDSLKERWEKFAVQLTINSSNIDLHTPKFDVFINGMSVSIVHVSCSDSEHLLMHLYRIVVTSNTMAISYHTFV